MSAFGKVRRVLGIAGGALLCLGALRTPSSAGRRWALRSRERPELVRQVITLGTPVIGGPRYTVAAGLSERQGYDLGEIESHVDKRNRVLIEVPITAIYSRRDAIVAWGACIDRLSPQVEHIEVKKSHLGLTVSPEVYRLVAQRLAAPRVAAEPHLQAV